MRRRIAVLLPVAAAAAAVAFLLRRLRGSGGGAQADAVSASRQPRPDAGAPPSDAPVTEAVEHTYTCDGCQTEYRVSGEGRHTVYWKADSSISDAVIDGKCVECGKPLPGHHPAEDDEEGDASSPEAVGDASAAPVASGTESSEPSEDEGDDKDA